MARSKIAKAKEEMGWRKFPPTCDNCKHYTSEITKVTAMYHVYVKEKRRRCNLGGFATSKKYWCRQHESAS